MPTWAWILIAIAAVLLVAAVAAAAFTRRRTSNLQQRFGHEYDRTVQQRGSRRKAEAELGSRVERRESLEIRTLSPDARERFLDSWRQLQTQFVDDPAGSVTRADALIASIMSERGYPVDDFERRAADISVDHPQVVERYRSAHGIAQKNDRGEATTEDLRQAIKHYRALFEELVEPAEDEPVRRDETIEKHDEREESAAQR
jgi:hypothetical protein